MSVSKTRRMVRFGAASSAGGGAAMIRRIFAALILTVTSWAVWGANPASAICPFSYQTSYISSWGHGQENRRYSSTCDGDGFYAGKVAETAGSNYDGVPATIRVSSSFNGPWVYVGVAYNRSYRSYNVQGSSYNNLQICDGYTGNCSGIFDLILF